MITIESFKKLFPSCPTPEQFVESMTKLLPNYKINTLPRIAAFIAQCGHESAGFSRLTENLNYSMQGLMSTWPKRFNTSNAAAYARQPEKIANKVYADRLGNGPESSGDGWRYKGVGLIQLTGKANYQEFAKFKGISLEDAVQYLKTIDGAVESACWFWNRASLNELADAMDIKAMTKKINGGYIGLEEREKLFKAVLKAV